MPSAPGLRGIFPESPEPRYSCERKDRLAGTGGNADASPGTDKRIIRFIPYSIAPVPDPVKRDTPIFFRPFCVSVQRPDRGMFRRPKSNTPCPELLTKQAVWCKIPSKDILSGRKYMKTGKRIRSAAALLLFAFLALHTAACGHATFNGNRIKNEDKYILEADLMNGTDSHTMELEASDSLEVHFRTEQGELRLDIADGNGTSVYSGDGKVCSDFVLDIQKSGVYTFSVTGVSAKGVIRIQKQTDQPST